MTITIPIYYGNPRVAEEFNRNAFIDCNKFDNDLDAVIEEVKRVDRDAELAKYMVMQNPMQKGYDFAWEERLLNFLTGMIEYGRRRYIQQTRKKVGGGGHKKNRNIELSDVSKGDYRRASGMERNCNLWKWEFCFKYKKLSEYLGNRYRVGMSRYKKA